MSTGTEWGKVDILEFVQRETEFLKISAGTERSEVNMFELVSSQIKEL